VRRWFGFSLDIEGKIMAEFARMGAGVMPIGAQASTIETSQTDIDSERIVLYEELENWGQNVRNERTWSSKHWVHSSR
jgi:hypothetical protein